MDLEVSIDQFLEITQLAYECEVRYDRFDEGKWISGLKSICGSEKISKLIDYYVITKQPTNLICKEL